jgi:hypothetical protein
MNFAWPSRGQLCSDIQAVISRGMTKKAITSSTAGAMKRRPTNCLRARRERRGRLGRVSDATGVEAEVMLVMADCPYLVQGGPRGRGRIAPREFTDHRGGP